jgi:beta-lactamase superfamily II metal-dependent hydrolase
MGKFCCPKERVCNQRCCPEGESCAQPFGICCPNQRRCGPMCCPPGQACYYDKGTPKCCRSQDICAGTYGPLCCPGGHCCRSGCCSQGDTQCCTNDKRTRTCCGDKESCCGDKDLCCGQNAKCCEVPKSDIGDQTLKNDTGTTNNKCSRPSASEKKKKTAETILMPPLELNSTLPAPNGNMNIFALPIGQGEANVIQCPSTNRALVIDIGSRGGLRMSRDAMANFINAGTTAGQTNVTHIIISHADADHCNWIPNIFNTTDRRANIAYVIIGGLRSDYPVTTRTWFSSLPATAAVIELNSGNSCLGNLNCGAQSQLADICGDGSVGIQIIAANMGSRVYTNTNSVIVKVTHHSTTMLFPGDFEDSSPTGNEQHDLVTHAGSSLPAEIYKVAHHGASTLANSVELLMAISPTYAIFSSRYPDRQYFHPRCATVNRLIFDITSIEVYSQNSNIPFACGYGDHTVWETNSICYGFFSTTPLPNGIQIVQVVSNAQGYSFIRTAVAPGMMENGDEVNDTCIISENDKIIDGKAHHDEL